MQTKRLTFNEYPLLLRQIERPPPFIDIAGSPIPTTDYKFLCIVGARKFTNYGEEVVRYLISGLKGYPIIIVSGLAIGIDSIAHEQALSYNLKTIAVPGSGLNENVIYPPSHINLARKIIESGNTLISPFEHNQTSALWTFPVRNRLMAGLSHATLVIEGREGSGTLLTAKHAIEFNRDVMIVPGSIFSDTTYGPHLLYKEGAIPITKPQEILDLLGFNDTNKKQIKKSTNLLFTKPKNPTTESKKIKEENNNKSDQIFEKLSDEEKNIITILKSESLSNSELLIKTGLSIINLNIHLTNLEMENLITYDRNIIKLKN